MPDEEIDKLVRDAANQHHPPYDDKSWGKMEVLLDKHLPQKKDRKKPIIFLLLFLLLGGAVFFALEQSKKNIAPSAVAKNTTDKNTVTALAAPSDASTTSGNSSTNTATYKTAISQQLDFPQSKSVVDRPENNTLPKNAAPLSNAENTDQQYAKSKTNNYSQQGRTKIKIKKPGAAESNDNLLLQKVEIADNSTPLTGISKTNDVAIVPNELETKVTKTDSVNKYPEEEKIVPAKNNTTSSAKKKANNNFGDKFAVTLSAGADVSFIEIDKAGKLKPAYGGGVSYVVGKHITVATGLYVSKKVYTATPYQYKFTGYVNPGLTGIGADCRIFEIPVSVYYNFKQVKNHNWLGGISLSSLLMKRETYDYNYQTASGQTYSYEKTITNQNKHYFSVLTLSGGYQYKLNNHFSFIAEPYIKIPLTGIGLGSVKLSSTGILVTAAVKPFAKKKK